MVGVRIKRKLTSCWGKLIMKVSWANRVWFLKEEEIFWHGDVGEDFMSRSLWTRHRGRPLGRLDGREQILQLNSGLTCDLGISTTSRQTFLSWMPFFFFPFSDFEISFPDNPVPSPYVYIFNGSGSVEIKILIFPVSNSSCYIIQHWKF